MTPKINWQPENKELKKFGWTILIGFGVIGAAVFFKGHRPTAAWIWSGAAFIWLLSMTIPILSKPFYWIWMGIAFVMGSIMSRVIMTVIFLIVITPVALIFKLIGRDALGREKPSKDVSTYWQDHPKISDPKYYDHLF